MSSQELHGTVISGNCKTEDVVCFGLEMERSHVLHSGICWWFVGCICGLSSHACSRIFYFIKAEKVVFYFLVWISGISMSVVCSHQDKNGISRERSWRDGWGNESPFFCNRKCDSGYLANGLLLRWQHIGILAALTAQPPTLEQDNLFQCPLQYGCPQSCSHLPLTPFSSFPHWCWQGWGTQSIFPMPHSGPEPKNHF